ncbi:MAG: hypothetical protein BGP10_12410 [Rhodanobacter sp. 68-29]|nr:hypothetical protein [Rhodanobacter sp.]ODV27989.1 MAG: hypothetical protein ABT19_00330 [Rhodanobacter sp. SCN 68-63]OJY60693.1 MAG: hypothetical protein BGP10_12410 [Rhodanobacter sp. 68-29]
MSTKSARIDYLAAALSAQFPARSVTRTFRMHTERPDSELEPGLFTVLGNGVADYPYEHSDYGPGLDAPAQTELGALRLIVTGQIKLAEGTEGAQVEAAEFDMLADLEAFANAAIGDDKLVTLRLLNARQSAQLDAPYGWIHTEWLLPLLEE